MLSRKRTQKKIRKALLLGNKVALVSYKGILKKNFKKNTFYLFFLFISIMNYAQSVDIESKITFSNGKEIDRKSVV